MVNATPAVQNSDHIVTALKRALAGPTKIIPKVGEVYKCALKQSGDDGAAWTIAEVNVDVDVGINFNRVPR